MQIGVNPVKQFYLNLGLSHIINTSHYLSKLFVTWIIPKSRNLRNSYVTTMVFGSAGN